MNAHLRGGKAQKITSEFNIMNLIKMATIKFDNLSIFLTLNTILKQTVEFSVKDGHNVFYWLLKMNVFSHGQL